MTENLTPMMRQYNQIKKNYPDAILFFRLGDFYEMFGEDAKISSTILNIALTKRVKVSMCGIPFHAAKNYIKKLLDAGKKVAICEQLTQPGDQKGIVLRDVVEVLTPGTIVDDSYLNSKENNFILAIGKIGKYISFSYIDLSTGEFFVHKSDKNIIEAIKSIFFRLNPKEIIIQKNLFDDDLIQKYITCYDKLIINIADDWNFDVSHSFKVLTEKFKTSNLKPFYIDDTDELIFTCSVLLNYIEKNLKNILPHINTIEVYNENSFLFLDEAAIRNLELIKNSRDNSRKYSLLDTIDKTKTAMGERKLKKWLLNPLIDIDEIKKRQDKVLVFFNNSEYLDKIRLFFSEINDLERFTVKLSLDKVNARDFIMLKNSLKSFLELHNFFLATDNFKPLLFSVDNIIAMVKELTELIEKAILEEPSNLLNEGKLIKSGFSVELDNIKNIDETGKKILERYGDDEKNRTSISNLKIKFNNIIGYYISVSKGNLDKVPQHFIRKQSLVNEDRFTTDRLLELESELNSAKDNIINLERNIFINIRENTKTKLGDLKILIDYIGSLDVFLSFAYCSIINKYVLPEINSSDSLDFIDSRHPVIENSLEKNSFVPNSIKLSCHDTSFALITGPNMAGKSTFLRQIAINVILAQIGCFVPAKSAKIGIVDKIFCRVGASDNLARGESTFLVEMIETANILRNATEGSLVIMDEVGRGTSTNDGVSIAQAICENLLNRNVKTIFATHYHELTLLKHERLKNYSLKVLEENNKIVFLNKLVDSPATNSYGIYVAKLAGIPENVITRAKEVLNSIEKTEKKKLPEIKEIEQLTIFSSEEIIINEIKNLDLLNITPLKLFAVIENWQKELK